MSIPLVITGASGWLGKSFLLEFIREFGEERINESLVYSQSPRQIELENGHLLKSITYDIPKIERKEIDYFVPSAFITQEQHNFLGTEEYTRMNSKLIEDSIQFISRNSIRCLINFSSGVVSGASVKQNEFDSFKAYRSLKERQEIEFRDICDKRGIKFINCRIYSLSGWYVIAPTKYAFYDVLLNCLKGKVNIQSGGSVIRKYMDSCDLMFSLLKAAQIFDHFECESTGSLVELEELARIASDLMGSKIEIKRNFSVDAKDDLYFSDDKTLDNLNLKIGYMPKSIEEQIIRSIKYMRLTTQLS